MATAVTVADGQAITSMLGAAAGDVRDRVEVHVNLDGLISSYDYSQWRKNLTDQTTVNPLAVGLTVTPNPTVLPDGTLVVDQASVVLSGATNPGATVKLDTDGNGDFGEGDDHGGCRRALRLQRGAPRRAQHAASPGRRRFRPATGPVDPDQTEDVGSHRPAGHRRRID